MKILKRTAQSKKYVVLATLGSVSLVALSIFILQKYVLSDTYTSTVVEVFDDRALDGQQGYRLNDGTIIYTNCGFCSTKYEGEIIGNPQKGNKVEIKVDADNRLTGKDTYIKKID